ncbi:conjugal transfer protein TrbN [Asaia bogorensis NBRC 16594]|uniref:Transglycosylase SLT domain-containing protein n=2 Tax=Asaia bogorensis TaxID=91915 RepID=A0AAN4R7A1_9PROT|nr:conjugal transfer protein TrbN [Asaia bogorensis NBRC 16594]GEL54841.1 hypothetical protein ABO01nite_28480 [Asaia bogorensis NBRC 16594]
MLPPCAHIAEIAYHVPHETLEQVALHRTGGIGPMGIQDGWLPYLARAGFDGATVRDNVCWNIIAAAWIIAASRSQQSTIPAKRPFHAPSDHPLSADIAACVADAARTYRIPEAIYRAVLMTEGGAAGTVSHNSNGSDDLGIAQINTSWLPRLAAQGVTRTRLLTEDCLNVHVGAWILGQELAGADPHDAAAFWRRVGNYNSHTPVYNQRYQIRVWRNLQRLGIGSENIATLSEK